MIESEKIMPSGLNIRPTRQVKAFSDDPEPEQPAGLEDEPETAIEDPGSADGGHEQPDETWTVEELRGYSRENGLSLHGAQTKAEILAQLNQYDQQEQAADTEPVVTETDTTVSSPESIGAQPAVEDETIELGQQEPLDTDPHPEPLDVHEVDIS